MAAWAARPELAAEDRLTVERDYARDVLVKMEGFPAPAPGSTRKFQRWRTVDVLRFAGLPPV